MVAPFSSQYVLPAHERASQGLARLWHVASGGCWPALHPSLSPPAPQGALSAPAMPGPLLACGEQLLIMHEIMAL